MAPFSGNAALLVFVPVAMVGAKLDEWGQRMSAPPRPPPPSAPPAKPGDPRPSDCVGNRYRVTSPLELPLLESPGRVTVHEGATIEISEVVWASVVESGVWQYQIVGISSDAAARKLVVGGPPPTSRRAGNSIVDAPQLLPEFLKATERLPDSPSSHRTKR
ncbi:MAG: hypothetical protein QM770_09205 [Tepidisphaeraceae bacterium]